MNASQDSGLRGSNPFAPEEVPTVVVEEDGYETITVQFSVNTKIPRNDQWTLEQKHDLAKYLATYSTRCIGEFQKFDWGCGAFMTQAFQDPEHPDLIRAHVTAIDKHLKFSTDDYTKDKFLEVFGTETFVALKRGWPRKHASTLKERLVALDAFEPTPPVHQAEEPKIVELL